ncbi:MAG: hypothetical protein GC164_13440 [Phycisphaera sp.]|nr:hypothetical protein [Phycisphaera sp.]
MNWLERMFPVVVCVAMLLGLAGAMRPRQDPGPMDLEALSQIPVMHEGRVKPIEAVARGTLSVLRARQSIRTDRGEISAVHWMLDVLTQQPVADDYPVFRIDDPNIKYLLDPGDLDQKYFSYNEITAHRENLLKQFDQANATPAENRSTLQRKLMTLSQNVSRYMALAQYESILPIPPVGNKPSDTWRTLDQTIQSVRLGEKTPEALGYLSTILSAYREHNAEQFNHAVHGYLTYLRGVLPESQLHKSRFEALYLQASPFYWSSIAYVFSALLVLVGYLVWRKPLLETAWLVALVTLGLHAAAIGARMYIHGRPPVTNLYASAVFVGFITVALGLFIEFFHRNGIGSLVAGITGFLSLVIAHNLSTGETMEAMRAVLNNNFWLATHVVVITMGYGATFLAGFISILYIIGVWVTFGQLSPEVRKAVTRMVYGTVCFALLLSFVGTVLGGIWADQSWGRFWGWDPKENGALLIVLWNALILHARWGGMVKERGVHVLAVGGNIVTAWSWFGVNMLGVGLHSYGFMDKALSYLVLFALSQVVLMVMGLFAPAWNVSSKAGASATVTTST